MVSSESPLVSILIPCFNMEMYVAGTVRSALAQTYKNIEIIVVDDGSTDNSLKIIQSFGNSIKYDSIPNCGACIARNRALEISRGEYIQFLDADDLLLPTKIETQIKLLLESDADLVFCRAFVEDESGNVEECGFYPPPDEQDPLSYVLTNLLGTNGPLIKRTVIEAAGGFRPNLLQAQEQDLYMRMAARGLRLIKTDQVLLTKRNHSGPSISKEGKGRPDYYLRVLLQNVSEMDASGYLKMHDRRLVLAAIISLHSSYSFRHGYRELAREGFKVSKGLTSEFVYEGRPSARLVARMIGPLATEHLLSFVRRIKYDNSILNQLKP